MSTIPSRLARVAKSSRSPIEARARVLQLYRDWYRNAPTICTLYALNVSPAFVRHSIRRKFEQNRHITDVRVIDGLLQKNRQEFQEAMNGWDQTDHILGILLQQNGRPARTFLQKFYEGRDEDAILPAATGLTHPTV